MPRRIPYIWVEALLIAALAIQCARLFWIAFTPLGPIGAWKGTSMIASSGTNAITSFDPFFRTSGQSATAIVTSLPLKLFGVRVDQATGRGSAIIAAADGVQQSFVVGDEVMPGIRLKSVAKDSVTIERAGVSEQLFLDQSVPAPVAQPAVPSDAPAGPGAYTSPPVVSGLRTSIAFMPRMENGVVTGFAVGPKGSGPAFREAGFQPGDVITKINGIGFTTVEAAAKAIGNIPNGTVATFTVDRAGRSVTVSAKGAP